MVGNYFRDGLNLRGPEYSATARAARAAENTQRAMDDMLALAMAPDEETRRELAQRIYARKQIEARRARRGETMQLIFITLFVLFIVGLCQLGNKGSTINRAYNAFVHVPLANAAARARPPVRQENASPDSVVNDSGE